MPEFSPPEEPTPNNTITAIELVNIITNRIRNRLNVVLYNGKDLKAVNFSFIQSFFLDDNKEYWVIHDLNIVGGGVEFIDFGTYTNRVNFLFYNCITSGIDLQNSKTENWHFEKCHLINGFKPYNSKILSIQVVNSKVQRIRIENSICNYINVHDRCELVSLELDLMSNSKEIYISDSKCGTIAIEKNSNAGSINIGNNSVCEFIWIDNGSSCENILILNESQTKFIHFDNISLGGNIRVEKNSQCEEVAVSNNSRCDDIRIMDSSRLGKIKIEEGSQCGDIKILKNSQCGEVLIIENSQSGSFEIMDSSLNKLFIKNAQTSLYTSNATISLIKFINCTISCIEWQAGSKGELYMEGGILHFLNLSKTSILKESTFYFSSVEVFFVNLDSLMILGQLLFRNIKAFKNVKLLRQWNTGITHRLYELRPNRIEINSDSSKFRYLLQSLKHKQLKYRNRLKEILNIISEPTFRITSSSLGKTEITGSNLAEFKFDYRDSKLLECFISGSKLPKNSIEIYKNNNPKTPESKRDFYEQKISVYNQFKKLFDNQGDIVEATWYHSKAMEHQQNLLRLNYQEKHHPKWYSIKKWFTEEGFDLFSFRLNKFSNNHGESWRKALAFILIFSLVFYTLYYIGLFHNKPFSFSGTGKFLGDYFEFLNITHRQDFLVEKEKLTSSVKAFDFLGRIFIGYGIYQFIAAFRRHGRK